jgi:hypothetical protein
LDFVGENQIILLTVLWTKRCTGRGGTLDKGNMVIFSLQEFALAGRVFEMKKETTLEGK